MGANSSSDAGTSPGRGVTEGNCTGILLCLEPQLEEGGSAQDNRDVLAYYYNKASDFALPPSLERALKPSPIP